MNECDRSTPGCDVIRDDHSALYFYFLFFIYFLLHRLILHMVGYEQLE